MRKLLNHLADQIDIGYGWIGDLISGLICAAMAIAGAPLLFKSFVVMIPEEWDTYSTGEQLAVVGFLPMISLVVIMLPVLLFNLAYRKFNKRK
jgi:hypothetical protein